ncbi:serine hydrolase domain-containing protein [Sphingomicrobium marinum]|uniref:serine hydrolase domain-containing protein n=1 Tax=Sphingomicrobium marinum TaxID=1227950 RepID=UPI0022409664|nr:serine hydrolase domain-containing protein [Sphingomicrobium marinum]
MRRLGLMLLAGLVLTACQPVDEPAPTNPDPMASLTEAQRAAIQRDAAQVLFWTDEQRFERFRAMDEYFPGRTVKAARARTLPAGEPLPGAAALQRYVEEHRITGLMVLQDGRIRFEGYSNDFGPDQRWTSFSVAKSLTSTLVGAALKDGHIGSLDDPLTDYIPELAGTAYDVVSVEDLLTMRSGVDWDENYADPNSDIAQLYSQPYQPGVDLNIFYLSKRERAAEPGMTFNYSTAETNLVGTLVERAVGRSLADYAREKIVGPAGFEGDLFWQVDPVGQNIGGCCLMLRLADYARFGQWFLEGTPDGNAGSVLSAEYRQAAITPATAFESAPGYGYGYQWWTYPGAYGAQGIFGQGITIVPSQNVVIAYVGNWSTAASGGRRQELQAAITRAFANAD